MPRLPEIFERNQLPEDKREIHDYLVKARGRISNGYYAMIAYAHNAMQVRVPDSRLSAI